MATLCCCAGNGKVSVWGRGGCGCGAGDPPPLGREGGVGEALWFCCRVPGTDGRSPQPVRSKPNTQGHTARAQIYARTPVKKGSEQPKMRDRVPRTVSLCSLGKQFHLQTSAARNPSGAIADVSLHIQVRTHTSS